MDDSQAVALDARKLALSPHEWGTTLKYRMGKNQKKPTGSERPAACKEIVGNPLFVEENGFSGGHCPRP